MVLPEKVHLAVGKLAVYGLTASQIAPRWYRWYLRFHPETPPPLFGANKGAWDLLAVAIGVLLWIIVDTFGLIVLLGSEDLRATDWGFYLFALMLVSLFGGIAGSLFAKATRLSFARQASILGLPSWQDFNDAWRPSMESLRLQANPSRFWLRSLFDTTIRFQPGSAKHPLDKFRQQPFVQYGGWVGFLAFFLFAWFFPRKADSYGAGMAFLYLIVCTIGIYRTVKARPLPVDRTRWELTHGLLIGVCIATYFWNPIADILEYPSKNAFFPITLVCIAMHLVEAVWFEQQKALALRAENAEAERQLAEMRLSALKAQVEPHFIFNTIAHLRRMIALDRDMAIQMADQLVDFLRASLKSLREEWTTAGEDCQLAKAYLQLAAIRMRDRLHFDVQVDAAAADVRIPPLMLLTLVENAVQHGIEPKEQGGHISVLATVADEPDGNALRLRVSDTGEGFGQAATAGTGVGLANIRERLHSVYGDRAELKLARGDAGGVTAEIIISMEKNS